MTEPGCGCCACLAGAGQIADVTNRPGLAAIHYRAGTHSTFYDAMIRRLTIPVDEGQPIASYSLHKLTTRESDDPAVAMLDAWATVGDVLTFYQERIANEGYLRTATERRSILELGRLVGYTLKPGVSASVYLAYTFDESARTIIPAGAKSQSIPGVDEKPQSFETTEAIEARGTWNALLPRMSKPQEITIENVLSIGSIGIDGTTTRFDVRDALLFVFEISEKAADGKVSTIPIYAMRRVLRTNADLERKRTEIVLEPIRPYYVTLSIEMLKKIEELRKANSSLVPLFRAFHQQVLLGVPRSTLIAIAGNNTATFPDDDFRKKFIRADDLDAPPRTHQGGALDLEELLGPLQKARGRAPASQWDFGRSLDASLKKGSDIVPRLIGEFYPQAAETIYTALANNVSGDAAYAQFRSVYVLRRRAAVFGYNAPTVMFEERPVIQTVPGTPEKPIAQPVPKKVSAKSKGALKAAPLAGALGDAGVTPMFIEESGTLLHLDAPDEAITAGSYVVTVNAAGARVTKALESETAPRTAYGISARSAKLTLAEAWFQPSKIDTNKLQLDVMKENLAVIRTTAVYAESEELTLAQQIIDRPVGELDDRPKDDPESEMRIELDRVIDGLTAGRWVIVTGERIDTAKTTGVVSAELAMIDNVEQTPFAGAGGTSYSTLVLAPAGLAYAYKRDTVKILGNVVKANNGATNQEILGGGDASKAMQSFTLHQTPLTYVAAPTVEGVVSTLAVRVNEVLWHRIDSLAGTGPNDRIYVTKTDDDAKVSVIFGNGRSGSRIPTGADNVRAVYRNEIGTGGNVRARQIATAITRPLGLTDVVNPLPATGGANPEPRDSARRNIPVSIQAMGRVVSVRDYADFARTFAGISKAAAVALSDGRRRIVHLTIGGEDDIEIDVHSDLYLGLVAALRRYGDPYQPFLVVMREKLVPVGSARVRVEPDYLWTSVGPNVRAALLDAFSYERRQFGQPIYPSEIVAVIQGVPGVSYVDLDQVGAIDTTLKLIPAMNLLMPILPRFAYRSDDCVLHPAQIAYLPPALADLFILTEITHD